MKIKLAIIILSSVLLTFNDDILNAEGKIINPGKNDNTIFIVMLITMMIWLALSAYIYYLIRKVKLLEKKVTSLNK